MVRFPGKPRICPMTKNWKSSSGPYVWFIPIVLIWAWIVMPSFLNPVWGSLDDGATLVFAEAGFQTVFRNVAGRVFPTFALRNWLLYEIGGTNPAFWYFSQSLGFLLTVLLIYATVAVITRHYMYAALAGVLFLTSSPIAENAYTISKCEPVVSMFVALLIFCMAWLLRLEGTAGGTGATLMLRTIGWASMLACIVLMMFAKESAIALVPLGPVGLLAAVLCVERSERKTLIRLFWGATMFLTVVGAGLLIARQRAMDGIANPYTHFAPSWNIFISNMKFYLSQSPDLILLLGGCVLAVFAGWAVFRGRSGTDTHLDFQSRAAFIFGISTLAAALGYYLILLVWRGQVNYYMLPVGTLLSLAVGLLAALLHVRRKQGMRLLRYCTLGILLTAAGAGRLYSIPYNDFIAKAQRGFDRLEDTVAKEALRIGPIQKRVIDVERASFVEQPLQRNLLYRLWGYPEFQWVGAGEICQSYSDDVRKAFGDTGTADKSVPPPSAGDLVLFTSITYPFAIELRGIGPRGRSHDDRVRCLRIWNDMFDSPMSVRGSWKSAFKVFEPWTMKVQDLELEFVLFEAGHETTSRELRAGTMRTNH